MSRKGISPLIAAVLLIAFTMAVASIFAQWAPQLVGNTQDRTSNQTDEILNCNGITLDVKSGDATTALITQKTGNDPVGDVTVSWFYSGDYVSQNTTTISSVKGTSRVTTTKPSGAGSLEEITAEPTTCEGASGAKLTK